MKRGVHLIKAVESTVKNSKPHKGYRIVVIGDVDGVRLREAIDKACELGRKKVEISVFTDPSKKPTDINDKRAAVSISTNTPKTTEELASQLAEMPPCDVIYANVGLDGEVADEVWRAVAKQITPKSVFLLDNYFPGNMTRGCAHFVDTYLSKIDALDVQVRTPGDHKPDVQMVWVRAKKWPLINAPKYVPPGKPEVRHEKVSELMVKAIDAIVKPPEKEVIEFVAAPAPVTKESIEKMAVLTASGMPSESVTITLPAETKEAPKAEATFQGPSGGDNTNVQSPVVRAVSRLLGDEKHAKGDGNGGGRREPRVEPPVVQPPAPKAADPAPVPEKRQEPDKKLELGTGESKGTQDPVRGADEQRREVPAGVVAAPPASPGPEPVRSRRAGNERTGPPTAPAG